MRPVAILILATAVLAGRDAAPFAHGAIVKRREARIAQALPRFT